MALACKVVLLLALAATAVRSESARTLLIADGVGEDTVLALPLDSDASGAFALDATGLRWIGSPLLGYPERIEDQLPGRPVAACSLAGRLLAVIVVSEQTTSVAVLQEKTPNALSIVQTTSLPRPHADTSWAVVADKQRLFIAADTAIYRSLYTAGGVSEPKPFATLESPVRSLAFGRRRYLAALTQGEQDASRLVFLNPTAKVARPLVRFDLPLANASAIAYSAAASMPDWPLYVAAQGGVYRVETQPAPNGTPMAAVVPIYKTEQPIRALLGIGGASTPRGEAGTLGVLAGDTLLTLYPPTP